jgi:catechol 2,3-dioxygenase-like lactoylglutathione lyase family enzyme
MKNCLVILLLSVTIMSVAQQEIKVQPYFSAIMVSNVEQSSKWYGEIFGLSVRNRYDSKEGGYKQVIMHSPDMLIELIEVQSILIRDSVLVNKPKGTSISGFSKFGFMAPRFDELHQFLTDKKVTFAGRTVRDHVSGKRTFLIRDPDNNLLQFFEP